MSKTVCQLSNTYFVGLIGDRGRGFSFVGHCLVVDNSTIIDNKIEIMTN